MPAALVLGCAVLGLVVGASLSPMIRRAPDRERRTPLAAAPTCAACDEPLPGSARVPVLVAPCPRCGTAPPQRDRWVQVTTGAVFAVLAAAIGPHPELVAYLFFGAVAVVVSFVDLDTLRIPDRVTFPALAISLALVVATSLVRGEPGWIVSALAGSALYFGLLLPFNLIYPAGMGFGDVKLGLLLGLFLGWISPLLVVWGLLIASVLGSVVGLAVVIRARDRKRAFPFGPMLCLGAIVAIAVAPHVLP